MPHRIVPTLCCVVSLAGLLAPPFPATGGDPAWDEYTTAILPFLENYCYACHGNGRHKGGLVLDGFADPDELMDAAEDWELVHEQVLAYAMPPEGKPQPTPIERQAVADWIDAMLHPVDCDRPDPGHVTVRRLNREEYNNTIRDLFGIHFRPADAFPADDTGYGFDNIGEVLSMSPLLMEKYLAAADAVLDRALVTAPPAPDRAVYAAADLQGGQPYRDRGRILASQGSLGTRHPFRTEGEYVIRVRAFAHQAGPDAARMAVRVGDKDVLAFDVTAVEDRPAVYEAKLRTDAGRKRCEAAFLNDFYQPGSADAPSLDRNLIVLGLEVEGPLDAPPEPLPASHRRIFTCQPESDDWVPCAREILETFTRRAYRRPPRAEEVTRLVALAGMARDEGTGFEESIAVALQAVLVSPHFLFRWELQPGQGGDGQPGPIPDVALASRLSYFLWSSMPDDNLLDAAESGRLREALPAQVRRMLADPRGDALARNFAGQWLQTRNLDLVQPDPEAYPEFDELLREAMRQETHHFFLHIQREDRSLLEFLNADYSFVNDRLARHYGIEGVSGPAFRRVRLEDWRRRGLLTQAGMLTLTSYPTRTSPVQRGKWVLENILGAPPPPPPPNVPELTEDAEVVAATTMRERMELHRADPVCASCHAMMDPIGFSMEHYDGVGAWRDQDGTQPIDSRGRLATGETFEGLDELRNLLVDTRRDQFTRCLAERMLTYALGRGLIPDDRCAVDRIVARIREEDYRFSSLVLGIAESVPFQQQGAVTGGLAE